MIIQNIPSGTLVVETTDQENQSGTYIKVWCSGTVYRTRLDTYKTGLNNPNTNLSLAGIEINLSILNRDSIVGAYFENIEILDANNYVVVRFNRVEQYTSNISVTDSDYQKIAYYRSEIVNGRFKIRYTYKNKNGGVLEQRTCYLKDAEGNSLTYNVRNATLERIYFESYPDKLEYFDGDTFTNEGMVVKANYVYLSGFEYSETINGYYISIQNGEEIKYSNGENQNVRIGYSGKYINFLIYVKSVDLSKCSFVGVRSPYTLIGTSTDDIIKPNAVNIYYSDGESEETTDLIYQKRYFNDVGIAEVSCTFTTSTTGYIGTLSYFINVYRSESDALDITLLDENEEELEELSFNYKDYLSLDNKKVGIKYLNSEDLIIGTIIGNEIHTDNEVLNFDVVTDGGYVLPIGSRLTKEQVVYIRLGYNGIVSTSNGVSIELLHLPLGISANVTKLTNKKTTDTFNKSEITIYYVTMGGHSDVTNECVFSLEDGQQFGNTTQIRVSYTNEFEEEYYLYIDVELAQKIVESLIITKQPNKLSYVENDILNVDGLEVKANYSNGYNAEIIDPSNYECYLGSTEGITVGGKVALADNGKKILVIYKTKQVQTNAISVSPLVLEDIRVTGVQTTAYIGDKLDKSGIKCIAIMNNGYETEVTPTYSFDGTFDSIGNKEVTISVTYGLVTKSKTFNINVIYASIIGLKVEPNNFGLTTGESWDLSKIKVYPIYANGYVGSEVTNYVYGELTFLTGGVVNNNYGLNTFNVAYEGAEETVYVTVNKNSQVKALNIKPNGKTYSVGEYYDAKDIDVFVQYVGDEEWYQYNSFNTNPAKGTLLRSAGILTVTVSAGELNKTYTLNVVSPVDDNYVDTNNYKLAFNVNSVTIDGETITFGKTEDGNAKYPLFNEDDLDTDNNYVGTQAEKDCIGYMEFGIENSSKLAHLVLFNDPVNPISGDGNIIVKYPHYEEGYADKINRATIGKIYNGRLFVSGNPKLPNCDWRTSEINTAQIDNYEAKSSGDFTYFADLHENYYGSDETKVIGYDNYSDGTLVVVKEDSRNEATIYYRNVSLSKAVNSAGTSIEESYEDNYPCFDVNSNGGIGGVVLNGIANFLGDTIFVSRQGIKRLTSRNTYNDEKITVDVSTFINTKITKEELEKSFLYTFDNRLILKTSRGVYVAYKELRDDNQYEWYFLDNVDARVFFEIDNELYFGDSEGNIKRFTENVFIDKSRVFIQDGGVLIDGSMAVSSSKYNEFIENGKQLHLTSGTETIFANLGSFISYNITQNNPSEDYSSYKGVIKKLNDEWVIELDIDDRFYTGREIFIDEIDGIGLDTSEDYYLSKVDGIKHIFRIDNKKGEHQDLEQINNFRFKIVVNHLSMCFISNVEDYEEGKKFTLKDNYGKDIEIVSTGASWSGVITTNEQNVVAYYITRPFDMGSLIYSKTIYLWTVSNDTDLASYMDVGYYINGKSGDYDFIIKTASGSRAFDFNFTNFNAVQFTSDKLPHIYTRQRTLPNVGFVRYIFKNENETNMVLTQMQLIYTYGQVLKGVN